MYLCPGIIYQPFYLHPNLRPRPEECTCAHVDLSPSSSKILAQIKLPKNCLNHHARIPELYNVVIKLDQVGGGVYPCISGGMTVD